MPNQRRRFALPLLYPLPVPRFGTSPANLANLVPAVVAGCYRLGGVSGTDAAGVRNQKKNPRWRQHEPKITMEVPC